MSKMTRRFALDKKGRKIYIGSFVVFNNKLFLVEDMEFLSWNRNQYLTLIDKRNKNKKIKFISANDVKGVSILWKRAF